MAPKGRHLGPRWFWRHDIGCLEDVPGLCLWGASAGLFPRDIIYGTPGTLVVRPIIITSNIATEEEQQVVVAFVLLLNVHVYVFYCQTTYKLPIFFAYSNALFCPENIYLST